MGTLLPTLAALALYALGYFVYARFLSRRIFDLSPTAITPAHALEDGVDYVPTQPAVLFGHHFASIAGLGPMLGPAVAVIWGWFPAMIWVVVGSIMIGCVHDFGALVVSLRDRGLSIGMVAEDIIGPRAKTLFHLVIFFGVALAMGVFVFILGKLFSVQMDATTPGYPGAATPSAGLMLIALGLGYLLYRRNWPLAPLAFISFFLSLGLIYLGHVYPTMGLDPEMWPKESVWIYTMLVYGFIASVLPVWVLLQARDFVNSLLLYLGLGGAYIGLLVLQPDFVAPAIRTTVDGAPSLWPFAFIVVACGAASGFHGLVSSGTTAKQIDKETDAKPIGYGGMIAESLLGLIAVIACTAGFASPEEWHARYSDWHSVQGLSGNVSAFISGTATFLTALGIPRAFGESFLAVVVVSFALTTLDSATRLLRYNIEEMADTLGLKFLKNRYLSSLGAVCTIAVFAFYEIDGKPAALALWTLFGTTNQLLAGLTLLTITVYLRQRGKNIWFTGIPAIVMLVTALVAMTLSLIDFFKHDETLLVVVGGLLWLIGVAVVVEGCLAMRRAR